MTLTVKALSLDLAKKMADAAEAKALEKEIKIAIAIMDNHGNLKYYRRMDGNGSINIRMSQLKVSISEEEFTRICFKSRDVNSNF
ncbi:MAG: heme-binding protein [Alphaproteobacteria bacterium]|nr:heme-binding protein [Alphaproteobacteria bacterium]